MTDQDKLKAALTIICEVAEGQCEGCEAGEVLWRQGDDGLILHGTMDDTMECESSAMDDAISAGLIEVETWPRCSKGHEWYGQGCPECEPAS